MQYPEKEYPDFDPAKHRPFKCYQCTNKHTCEHGFKTYRIPRLEELGEYYGYGIYRNINSGPIPIYLPSGEGKRTSDSRFERYPKSFRPGPSNAENRRYQQYCGPEALSSEFARCLQNCEPGPSFFDPATSSSEFGSYHQSFEAGTSNSKLKTSNSIFGKYSQNSVPGPSSFEPATSSSEFKSYAQSLEAGTSNSKPGTSKALFGRYSQNSEPGPSNSEPGTSNPKPALSNLPCWRNPQNSRPGASKTQNWRSQQNSTPETSSSQSWRIPESFELETSNSEYGRYPHNQYTIPRRYYPYDYHLSRDMILMRIRNGRMNQ